MAAVLSIGAWLLASTGADALPWLAWLSPLPLFLAIRTLDRVGAVLYGGIWGSCLLVFGTAIAPCPLSPLLTSLLIVAVPATYAGLGTWLTRRIGFHPLFLGLMWVGAELAMGPLGFHRGLLGGAGGDWSLVHQIGSLFGYVLVAFLVAWANASVLGVLAGIRFAVPRGAARPRRAEWAGCFHPRTDGCTPVLLLSQEPPRGPPRSSCFLRCLAW
ncbi:MAG: hypothetical protein AB1792_05290 [Candidatus Zixiibacteriota bacterium]